MKFDIRRVAAAGAVSALAAGALVATASTAQAFTTVSNTYTCTAPIGSPFPVFLSSSAPNLDLVQGSGVAAGSSVVGGLLSVNNHFTIPNQVHDLMASLGVTDMTFPDFAGEFGGQTVGVSGVSSQFSDFTADTGGQTWSADATPGANDAFTVPAAGQYDVNSPSAFQLVANRPAGPLPVSCVIADGTTAGSYANLNVFKNVSTTTAKATRTSFVKGKTAKVAVTVAAAHMPTGKVLLKNKAGKTLDSAVLNSLGKATLSTTRLPVGKNALKVLYKGDGYDLKSNAPVTVKVVR
jgi:hypothetical protein